MNQDGNTGRTTEEPARQDTQPEGMTGEPDAPPEVCTLSVYRAEMDGDPSVAADAGASELGNPADSYPDGFTGTLTLQNLESFDVVTAGEALSRVAHLISWGQAQQVRLINRMEELFRDNFFDASERDKPGIAFSLAASECAAILNVPQVTGERLLSEAGQLCGTHTATLSGLEEGRFSYQHAQVVLDQCQNVPASKLPGFEADLLKAAEGQTRAQFSAKARRLRERNFPETVSKRHLTAFEQRMVTLDREEDGMSCLSAYLRAAEAQQIYTALSTAARGEQAGGDSRTTDQLRADILAQMLMGGLGSTRVRKTGGANRAGGGAAEGAAAVECGDGSNDAGPDEGIIPRAEIMVLINAETLFGADDQPAELHGYGPISAESARRLARNAAGWTGLAQDPHTGEILGVGRRRKVPAGLRRWLRARDGTCRFPGCRVNTAVSDIDHTIDWAKGGPTEHGNLEHLCRRHHRFKTLGYWKACQPTPGVMEWTSPTGRIYRTEPVLDLDLARPKPGRRRPASDAASGWGMSWEQEDSRRNEPKGNACREETTPPF